MFARTFIVSALIFRCVLTYMFDALPPCFRSMSDANNLPPYAAESFNVEMQRRRVVYETERRLEKEYGQPVGVRHVSVVCM